MQEKSIKDSIFTELALHIKHDDLIPLVLQYLAELQLKLKRFLPHVDDVRIALNIELHRDQLYAYSQAATKFHLDVFSLWDGSWQRGCILPFPPAAFCSYHDDSMILAVHGKSKLMKTNTDRLTGTFDLFATMPPDPYPLQIVGHEYSARQLLAHGSEVLALTSACELISLKEKKWLTLIPGCALHDVPTSMLCPLTMALRGEQLFTCSWSRELSHVISMTTLDTVPPATSAVVTQRDFERHDFGANVTDKKEQHPYIITFDGEHLIIVYKGRHSDMIVAMFNTSTNQFDRFICMYETIKNLKVHGRELLVLSERGQILVFE